MAPNLTTATIQGGLTLLDTVANQINICSAEPTSYAQATGTGAGNFSLGFQSFSTGGAFGPPANASPNGRQVTSTNITNGTITNSGTAASWAVVDTVGGTLYAVGDLSASVVVSAGQVFTLPPFVIRLPAS